LASKTFRAAEFDRRRTAAGHGAQAGFEVRNRGPHFGIDAKADTLATNLRLADIDRAVASVRSCLRPSTLRQHARVAIGVV
jgi:hypothetical protein